jgi:hypothetical protein
LATLSQVLDTAQGFVVLTDEQRARYGSGSATPAAPEPQPSTLPLPAWADRPEALPGFAPVTEKTPTPGYAAAPQPTAQDLIIESRQSAHNAWLANPNLRDPANTVGSTDGGPGQWRYSPMRTGGETYQEQVTGVPRGVEYQVNGVWFDGYDATRGVLVDAKDWVGFPPADAGFWRPGVTQEARDQLDAASGTGAHVEWHVASQAAADALHELFRDDRLLSQIRVIVVSKD